MLVGRPDAHRADPRRSRRPERRRGAPASTPPPLNLGDMMDEAMQSPVVGEQDRRRRSPTSTSPATTTWQPASRWTASAIPHRVIVGHRDPPAHDRHGTGPASPATRTSSATSPGPAGTTSARPASAAIEYGDGADAIGMSAFHGDYPWLTARCGDIDITGPPPPAVVLPGDRVRPPHRPVRRGAPARAPRQAGRHAEPVVVERRRVELDLARLRGRAGRRRGLRRRRRGGAAASTAARSAASRRAPTTGSAPSSRPTYEPGELAAVACRDGEEVGRTSAAFGHRRRCCSTCASTAPRSAPTPPTSRSSRSPGRRRRHRRAPPPTGRSPSRSTAPACSRASAAATRAPRRRFTGATVHDLRRSRARRRPTDGRGHDHRRPSPPTDVRRRTGACASSAVRDLGAALAPVPGRVGALHRAPRRAPVDRRGRSPTTSRRCPTTTRWRRSAGASPRRTPTTAACSCSPTTSRCSRPTRPSRRPATTCTAPDAPSAPPRSSATTTTPRSRWPTSTTTR